MIVYAKIDLIRQTIARTDSDPDNIVADCELRTVDDMMMANRDLELEIHRLMFKHGYIPVVMPDTTAEQCNTIATIVGDEI